MPFFEHGNARIYYEESGAGEPVIAVHGLIENTTYWDGIADAIRTKYRFIPMDMRAHGQTVVQGKPHGFDDVTIASDILALADHLNFQRFHLLTHSTGGFVSVRQAMRDFGRFASLILTDTASSTALASVDAETLRKFNNAFARGFEKHDWEQIIAGLRKRPDPFFRGIQESHDFEQLLQTAYEMMRRGDRLAIAAFIRSFYTDPDPNIPGLRGIRCPVLIIYGEKDDLFIESSQLMAREIPGAQIIEYPGAGHMTAIETPERLASDILDFLEHHPA